MLEFRAADPFPLIDLSTTKQSDIYAHAAACDRWLGFNIEAVERQLSANGCRSRARETSHQEKQQIWLDLDPQMLLTPYTEIRYWLDRLMPKPGQRIVDLGAAYGRMGFVLQRHYPQVEFTGYEYVGERVQEGNRALERFGAGKARIEHVDLSSAQFLPPSADFYFLYDFGTPKAIEKILYDLRRLGDMTLIVRGRHSRYLIERNHSWLYDVFPDEPESRVTVYKSNLFNMVPAGSVLPTSV